ncbi:MAG TPA: hypothetical protein ENJ48_01975 [Anaerolineae bacterium]|nr:hypothetical protein [Anaerolineae bacterium]
MSSQSISFKPTTVIKNISWGIDGKHTAWLIFGFLLISLVGWLYLVQASAVTSASLEVNILHQKITDLSRQNDVLRARIAEAESMARIQQRATELQMAPTAPANIEYMVVPNLPPLATEPAIPGNIPAATPPTVSRHWYDGIIDWFAGVNHN